MTLAEQLRAEANWLDVAGRDEAAAMCRRAADVIERLSGELDEVRLSEAELLQGAKDLDLTIEDLRAQLAAAQADAGDERHAARLRAP